MRRRGVKLVVKLLGSYAHSCGTFVELDVERECVSVKDVLAKLSEVCGEEIDLDSSTVIVDGRPAQSGDEKVCLGEKVVVVPMGVGG